MKFYFRLSLIIVFLFSCKKNDNLELCETGSVHSPFANQLGIEKNVDANKISFEIGNKQLSLNCPDLEENDYFSILYMILPDQYYGMVHSFTFRIRIPNYPNTNNLSYIDINLYEFKGVGKYALEHQYLPSGRQNITTLKIEGDTSKPYYYVQRRSYGWIEIQQFDRKSYKIKGNFEFDLVNDKNYSDTIKIRKGVFESNFAEIS